MKRIPDFYLEKILNNAKTITTLAEAAKLMNAQPKALRTEIQVAIENIEAILENCAGNGEKLY